MRSAGLWNFLAGTSAAAGTTLLTAIPAGREKGTAAVDLAIASGPWFLLAFVLAYAAARIEHMQRGLDLQINEVLEDDEVQELQKRASRKAKLVFWACDIGSFALLVLGVFLLTSLYR